MYNSDVYCKYCGKEIDDKAYVCVGCGRLVNEPPKTNNATITKYLVAGILGFFFGEFGVHNFITGKMTKGIIQIILSILSVILILLCTIPMYFSPVFSIVGVLMFIGVKAWSFVESIIILTKI